MVLSSLPEAVIGKGASNHGWLVPAFPRVTTKPPTPTFNANHNRVVEALRTAGKNRLQ